MKIVLTPRRDTLMHALKKGGWRLAGRTLLVGLAVGCCVVAGCFVGVDFEKVDEEVGCSGTAAATPGTCNGGDAFQLNGSGSVEVTDMALLDGQGGMVLVGRFSGTFSPPGGGPQLDAGGETEGFLLELDGSGDYVAHLVIAEADETSVLRVAVHSVSTDIVVAAKYENGASGGCTSPAGVFAMRLGYDASMGGFLSRFPNPLEVVCIEAVPGTELHVNDVGVYPETPYIQVVGAFDGTLGGATSQGLDGFAISIDESGVVEPLDLVTGSGDATVVAAMPSWPNNEWLLVGHFTGVMEFAVPMDAQTRTAANGTDLFAISYDGFAGDPNLTITTFSSLGGDHRAVGLAYDAAAPTNAVLLAQLDGGIFVSGNVINGEGGTAALAMAFQVPVDSTSTPFALHDAYLLRAAQITPHLIAGVEGNFLLAGEAVGPVSVMQSGNVIGEIASQGCQRDAFMMSIVGNTISLPQRCGDGQQQLAAIAKGPAVAAIALTVPGGAALNTVLPNGVVDGGSDTFILSQ